MPKRYKELLDQQRMTAEDFESKVKRDLVLRQLVGNLANTGFTSSAMLAREKLLGERREIQTVVMPAQDYVGAVSVSDAEIKKYYDTTLNSRCRSRSKSSSLLPFLAL